MKPFLFAYSQLCPDVVAEAILNRTNAVATWVRPFPNTAVILSSLEAGELGPVLHAHLGDTWFVVAEIDPQAVQGWLPANIWQFLNQHPDTHTPSLIGSTIRHPSPGAPLSPPYVNHPGFPSPPNPA